MKTRLWRIYCFSVVFPLMVWLFVSERPISLAQQKVKNESDMAEVTERVLYCEMKGQGEPIVMIHGGQLDRRMWDDQFELFAKNYKVIRYDVRNYGKSEKANKPYSDIQDLYGLLQFLNLKKVHLIGLSLGGRIAIDFALSHPEMVDSLMPVAAGLSGWEWSSDSNQEFWNIIKAARDESIEKAVDLWLKNPMMVPAMENPVLAKRILQLSLENADCWFANPYFEREFDPPAAKRLSEIRCPTLVIVGDRDAMDILKIADTLEKQIAGARKVVITGAGHMVNMEKPEQFNRAVLDFLKNH